MPRLSMKPLRLRTLLNRAAQDPGKRVRLAALEVLTASPDQRVIDLLIGALRDDDEVVRFGANKWLEQLTQQSLGFRPTDPEEKRETAVRRWEAWWCEHHKRSGRGEQ